MGLLDGRAAAITGGASGIGRATAVRFAAEGARVAILDRDEAAAQAVAQELGGVAIAVDVSDPEACRTAVNAASDRLGGLGILFNNAGVGAAKPFEAYSDRAWSRIVDTSLTATFAGIQAAAPLMREAGGGAIVNCASVSGVRPTRFEAPYSAAKAAVISLTMAAALEYAPAVRVNCVSPGMIETPLTEPALGHAPARAAAEGATPLGRLGSAEEVADAVLFLASPLSRYVTGHNLVVDGGSMLPNAQADAVLRAFVPEG
jgi:NAD(P)-dependent dehydrogenase (short-subunit alcohol dehydrogenase family)